MTDNADLILYRDGLVYLRAQLLTVLNNLAAFAKNMPTRLPWAIHTTSRHSP